MTFRIWLLPSSFFSTSIGLLGRWGIFFHQKNGGHPHRFFFCRPFLESGRVPIFSPLFFFVISFFSVFFRAHRLPIFFFFVCFFFFCPFLFGGRSCQSKFRLTSAVNYDEKEISNCTDFWSLESHQSNHHDLRKKWRFNDGCILLGSCTHISTELYPSKHTQLWCVNYGTKTQPKAKRYRI